MEPRPKTRADGLIVEPLDDGLVVYDSAGNQAHALDAAAARVWGLADGTRTLAEIADTAGLELAATEATLSQLQDEDLLDQGQPGLSRRKLLKRTALAGAGALAAAPLIETVIIPTAAAHASTMNTPQTPPTHPGGPPLVLEQPPVVRTPKRITKKKKKKKKLRHVHRRHKRKPKRRPSFTG